VLLSPTPLGSTTMSFSGHADVCRDDFADEKLATYLLARGHTIVVAETHTDGNPADDSITIRYDTDDAGYTHFLVVDRGEPVELALSLDDAWGSAVEVAQAVVKTGRPFDIAYDLRIPARHYGDRDDLLVGVPTH
jgi:hypothetical protein